MRLLRSSCSLKMSSSLSMGGMVEVKLGEGKRKNRGRVGDFVSDWFLLGCGFLVFIFRKRER